ncbi:MAG TPA: hypothetical protein VIP98_07585 [Microlunatus sp.]
MINKLASTKIRTATAAAAAGLATLALTAAPAEASTQTAARVSGAYGVLSYVEWASSHKVNFYLDIVDTAGDGEHATGRVQILVPDGDDNKVVSYGWHSAVGKGDTYSSKTYAQSTSAIYAVRIEVCRTGDELPTICDTSPWDYRF